MKWLKWKRRHGAAAGLAAALLVFVMADFGPVLVSEADVNGKDSQISSSVSTDSYNVMLVIDKSGSMNATDREHLAQDAAKMFIDSLNSTDGLKGSRAGVISFSEEAELLTTPAELNSQGQADYVKARIASVMYDPVNTGGTNLGKAVKLAAETLREQQDSNRENLILLFTDGYTEGAREESERLLNEALETARAMDCEIYVIGLNYRRNGSTDTIKQEGREKIAEIADATQIRQGIYQDGGEKKVNYLITDSLKEVYDFYLNVYALLRGSVPVGVEPKKETDGGVIKNVYDVPITEEDVIEANVFLISGEEVGEVTVCDPEGREASIDGGRISLKRGEQYAVLKLTKPSMGTWRVKTPEQVDYYVTYILSRGIELAVVAKKGDAENEAVVTARAMYNHEEMDNPRFYQELTRHTFSAVSGEGGEEIAGDMEYDPQEGCMKASFRVELESDYQITVTIADEQFERVAHTTMHLGGNITPDSGTEEESTLESTEEKSEGETKLGTMPVTNPDPVPKRRGWVLYIGRTLAAMVLLLIIAWIFYRKRIRRLDGQFRITVEGGGLRHAHSFTKTPFGGSSIHLDIYLRNVLEQEFGKDSKAYQQLVEAISVNKKELHKIVLIMCSTTRDGRRKETYMFRRGNQQRKTLGGQIFENRETEDRTLRLRVEMDYLSKEELESEEKGW